MESLTSKNTVLGNLEHILAASNERKSSKMTFETKAWQLSGSTRKVVDLVMMKRQQF